jgi:hypothetical protein
MSKRERLREQYIEGWYQMDEAMLMATVTDDFVFDDPAEPAPVTKDTLPVYMLSWEKRAREAGSKDEWLITDWVREDKDGVLTDWESWAVVGTDLQGMAMVKTSDDGVFLERISYIPRRR